jgi:RNA polymerase sigma factor (sigma-70 family)
MQDEKIINSLKNHDMSALQYIYQEYRKEFIRWAAYKHNIELIGAEDVFSDSVIDLYLNVVQEKYKKSENTTLKSYLFEIGKNKILNIIAKKRVSETHLKNIAYRQGNSNNPVMESEIKRELAERTKELMGLLDLKCQKILTLFYFHSLSMDEIAQQMEFKNEDVAKNKKAKCFKRIQQLTFERFAKTDFFE